MGLFGWIGGGLKALGRAFGRGVEWVGEKTGIWAIEKAGMDIQDACAETGRRTGETREYDRDTATADETAKIADILSGFSLGLKGQAMTIEQESRNYVEGYFDALILALEGVIGQCASTRNLRNQKKLIAAGIEGQLTNTLAGRVALTDSECRSILSMKAGQDKEKKMDEFGKKVIKEGLNSLCDTLDQSLNGVCQSIAEEMDALAEEQKQGLQNLIEQLQKITEKRAKDTGSREESMLLPAQKLAASSLVLDLVEERDIA